MFRYIEDKDELIVDDYFAIDLTYEELKTLKVHQRYSYRDPNYDGLYSIPSFEEFLDIFDDASHPVAIYPEVKDPEWTNAEPPLQDAGVTLEQLIVDALEQRGYTQPDGRCIVQTFGSDSINRLRQITNLPLVRLSNNMLSDEELEDLAGYAYGIGVKKTLIVEVDSVTNLIVQTTDLIDRAHAQGLKVHTYTMQNEYEHLAFDYGQDPYEEFKMFDSLGIDGIFTDFPSSMVRYREWQHCNTNGVQAHHIYYSLLFSALLYHLL